MRSNQRKLCVVVVKRGWLPRRGAVANIALLRKSSRNVIRIRSVPIVLQVAADTCCARQVVDSVLVAITALQLRVRTGQRKSALGVVERSRLPSGGAVADRAVRGHPSGNVIRIRRVSIILHVA